MGVTIITRDITKIIENNCFLWALIFFILNSPICTIEIQDFSLRDCVMTFHYLIVIIIILSPEIFTRLSYYTIPPFEMTDPGAPWKMKISKL